MYDTVPKVQYPSPAASHPSPASLGDALHRGRPAQPTGYVHPWRSVDAPCVPVCHPFSAVSLLWSSAWNFREETSSSADWEGGRAVNRQSRRGSGAVCHRERISGTTSELQCNAVQHHHPHSWVCCREGGWAAVLVGLWCELRTLQRVVEQLWRPCPDGSAPFQ